MSADRTRRPPIPTSHWSRTRIVPSFPGTMDTINHIDGGHIDGGRAGTGADAGDAESVWRAILSLNRAARTAPPGPAGVACGPLRLFGDGRWEGAVPPGPAAALCELYLPLVAAAAGRRYVAAHIGQSLDGRIATCSGASRWVTGDEDVTHNHRMRALADAVLVGAGTVRHDDPQLTVRRCVGRSPVRVVIDTERRLPATHGVFGDGRAPTLLLSAEDRCRAGERLGRADVIGIPRRGPGPGSGPGSGLDTGAVLDALEARGLRFVFIEGGGITISRFLEAGRLDRLQVTVAPLILGSGRPSFTLPEIDTIDGGLRPPTRRFTLGSDVMFDCVLHG